MLRSVLGFACLSLGVLGSWAACREKLSQPLLLFSVGAPIALAAFTLCRRPELPAPVAWVFGAVASYVGIFAGLAILSWLEGSLADFQRWLPILLLMGIPVFAPLIVCSGVASIFLFPPSRK